MTCHKFFLQDFLFDPCSPFHPKLSVQDFARQDVSDFHDRFPPFFMLPENSDRIRSSLALRPGSADAAREVRRE
jgi:hypothetical protein